jgi:hypothetical protein
METRKPNVLLIGESAQGSSYLASLDKRGCECSFATSCREAFLLLRIREFDLVLSQMSLRDGTAYPLMSLLEGSTTTVFYSHAVEHGCWWLPALRRGEKCFGSPALRPREFVTLLDETIDEIRRDTLTAAESQPLLIIRAYGSVLSASPPAAEPRATHPARAERPLASEAQTKSFRRATLIAANTDRFFGVLFIIVGVWQALRGSVLNGL